MVCEGEKTEPLYFHGLRQDERLSSAHVRIMPSDRGTSPLQVVEYAEHVFGKSGRAFERVYAVFDRDEHAGYAAALAAADRLDGRLLNDARQAVAFKAVPSVPCFELWLLLHYEQVFEYFERGEALQRLRRHIPDYDKAATGIYVRTKPNLAAAGQWATWLRARFGPLPGNQPYTDVDRLVEVLFGLRNRAIV